MSIATEIQKLQSNLNDAYTALSAKGATMPEAKTMHNLSATIDSVPSGGQKTYNIDGADMFGIYDSATSSRIMPLIEQISFDGFELIDDDWGPRAFTQKINTTNVKKVLFPVLKRTKAGSTYSASTTNVSGIRQILNGNKYVEEISLPHLEIVDSLTATAAALTSTYGGLYQICYNATSLKNVDLGSLRSIGNGALNAAFSGCTSLSSADLSSLEGDIPCNGLYNAFNNCTSLQHYPIDFTKITHVGRNGLYNAFYGCSNLQDSEIHFTSLSSLDLSGAMNGAFNNNTSLSSIYFDSLTTLSSITNTQGSLYDTFRGIWDGQSRISYLSVYFSELTSIVAVGSQTGSYSLFGDASTTGHFFFPKLTTIATDRLWTNSSGPTTVHFAAAHEATIQQSPGWSSKWHDSNLKVLFDL